MFKTPIGPCFSLGSSNNFVISANFTADLPNGIPIKPFLDLGYFDNAMPTGIDATFEDQFLWSAGLEIQLIDEILEFYFPIIQSRNLSNIIKERGSYWTRISFHLGLNELKPLEPILPF